MNRNVIVVVFVSVALCGVVGASVGSQSPSEETAAQQSTPDEGLGGDVSVFMQRGAAAANGSVDSGMWLAAFETAENQSRKEMLVVRRAETLGVRLDRLEERTDEFSPTETNRSVAHRARWARLAADAEALRTSINEAKTAAASEGVNASGLDRLSRRAENLSVPNATPNDSRTTARENGTVNADTASHTPLMSDSTDTGLHGGVTYRGP